MKKKHILLFASAILLVALMLLVPSSQANMPGGGVQENEDSNLSLSEGKYTAYVDSADGVDDTSEYRGTQDSPYGSITFAMKQSYQDIIILGGEYTASSEEQNGINIDKSISLMAKYENVEFNAIINIVANGGFNTLYFELGGIQFNETVSISRSAESSDCPNVILNFAYNTYLNDGLNIIGNIDVEINGAVFQNNGIICNGSNNLYLRNCTFTNPITDDLTAIDIANAQGDINIEFCTINATLSAPWLQGICVTNASGDVCICDCKISDASYDAVQISKVSKLTLIFNDFKNWDCDNDHFTNTRAPAGRAINIQNCNNLEANIISNCFYEKDYGNNPVFGDPTNASSGNVYADGNILKISDDIELSSLTCYYNYLTNESEESHMLSTDDNSLVKIPNGSSPSVAYFQPLEYSGITEIYDKNVADLGKIDTSFGKFIFMNGFLPYITDFIRYSNNTLEQNGHYLAYVLELPYEITDSVLSNVSGPIIYQIVGGKSISYNYTQIVKSNMLSDKENAPLYIVNIVRVTDVSSISIEVDWDGDGSKYVKSTYDLDLSGIYLGLENNDESIASMVEFDADIKPDAYSLDIGTCFDNDDEYMLHINASSLKQYKLEGTDGYWIGINVSIPSGIDIKGLISTIRNDFVVYKNVSQTDEYLTVYIDINSLDFRHYAFIDLDWWVGDYKNNFQRTYVLDFSNVTRSINSFDEITMRGIQDNPPSGEDPINTDDMDYNISATMDWDNEYEVTINSKNISYCRNSDGEWGYWIELAFKVPDFATPENTLVHINNQYQYLEEYSLKDGYVTITLNISSYDVFKSSISSSAGPSTYRHSEYTIDVTNAEVKNVSPYIVAFESNTSSYIPYMVIPAGENVNEPENLVKDNYTLVGWYKEADFKTLWNFETDTVNSNMTLYAKWEGIPKYLQLTLLDINSIPINSSEIYLSPVNDNLTRIPMTNSSIPGTYTSSKPLSFGKYYLSIGDMQYAEPLQVNEFTSAHYLTNLCIFNLNFPAIPSLSADADIERLYFNYDPQYTLTEITRAFVDALVEYDIYIDGWYTDSGYNTPYAYYYTAEPGETTLYLKVIDKSGIESSVHNITYIYGDNEYITLAPSSYISAVGATLPELNIPGYKFLGWYEDPEFSNEVENISPGETGDKTFYAKLEYTLCDVSLTFIDADKMPLVGLSVSIIKDYGDKTLYHLIESTSTPGTYTASNIIAGQYFIYLNGAQYTSMKPLDVTNENFTETFDNICLMIVDVSSIDPSAFDEFYQGILEEGTLSVFFDKTALKYILCAEAQEMFEKLVPSGYEYKGVYKDPGYVSPYEFINEEIPAQIRFYVKAFDSNADDSTIHDVTISLSDVSGPINDLEVSLRQYNEEYLLLNQINFTDLGNGTYRNTAVPAGTYNIYIGSEPYAVPDKDNGKIVVINDTSDIVLENTCCLTLDMRKFITDALSIAYGQSGFIMPYKALTDMQFDNYGYTLEGWYTDPELTDRVTSDVTINNDTTLYVNLTKISSDVIISIIGASGPITDLEVFLKPHNDESLHQVAFTDLGNGTYSSTAVPAGKYSVYIGSEPYILVESDGKLEEKIVNITGDYTIDLSDTCCLTLNMSKFIPNALSISYVQSGVILPYEALATTEFDDYGYNLEGWYTNPELTDRVTSDVTINNDTTLYVNLTKISSGGNTPSVPTTPTVPDEKPVVKEDEVKNENGTTSSITETTTKKENADGSKETTVEKKEEVKDENGKVQSVIEETSKTTENKDGSKETVVEKKEEVKDENGSVQSVKEEKVSEKVTTDGTVNKTSETTVKDNKGNTLEEKTSVSLEDKTSGITTTAEIKKDADGSVTAETVSKVKVNSEEGKASVSKEVVDAAVQHAEEVKKIAEEKGAAVTPTLEIETSSSGTEAETELPAEALAKLADAEVNVKVKTDVGDIELPPEVAKNLASKGEDAVSLSIGKADKEQLNDKQKEAVGDSPVFTLSSKAGDQDIHELGGTVKITVPYELKAGENPEKITVWYVDDLGNIVKKNSVYDPELKALVFETDHFSFYFIAEDTSAAAAEKNDNTLYYVLAAVIIIIVLAAAAYFLHKKK